MAEFPRKVKKVKKETTQLKDENFESIDVRELSSMMDQRIQQAVSFFDVKLSPDDPGLGEQLTLGNNWDDPFALTKAMDTQPVFYSQWATILRKLKREKQQLQMEYDVWQSTIKDQLTSDIFNENIHLGMTANNSKPTNQSVDNRFNSIYVNVAGAGHADYIHYREPVDTIDEKIDTIEIVVKAFEQRKDMLISLSSLVRGMIDNQLMIYRKKHKDNS